MTRLRRALSGRGGQAGFSLPELLIAMLITSIIATAVTSTVIATMRVEETERSLQDVIDDGRRSLTDIRRELRAARRIYAHDDPADLGSALHFWVDQNQNALVEPDEQICYIVEELADTDERFEISRVTGVDIGDCVPGVNPPAGTRRVLARTLVNPEPFVSYSPMPGEVTDPATREVTIRMELEVLAPRSAPSATTVEGSIRLRNVP